MDQSVFNEITQLIDALRAETTVKSISPERMGALLQRIVDILPDLDDSEIGNAARTALEAAQAAVNLAQSAIDHARTASTVANDAAGIVSQLSSDVATAISNALSALRVAQSAATAAQQATSTASNLSGRVSTLERYRTTVEETLAKTPEYHSASWLDNEQGVFDAEHPERRKLVRYTSMVDALNGGKKLIKKNNIVASGINLTSGVIVLSFVEVGEDKGVHTSVYRVVRPSSADYCVVEKTSVPMPAYNANWALRYGGTREQLDEFINFIESTPQVPMMVGNQPIVWAARRNNNVVQFATITNTYVRTYTVTYDEGAGETNTTYEDHQFISS
ncbi:MAG: hypothetical protein IJG81_11610 [Muribaculaceae bacterium]|nr:hypothetical protein [Muribaculaceae bacterium]